ncbi:MAG: NFACT RNA binding domain-containing protein [Bacteroidia bacterium]|nr:NFACT RNA binding domain-containing protein [Bacteroidia bacterium]MDW8345839.1 NFACT RNA binding domain-containing protein [Bacteroidia bacterium]
MHLTYFTLLQIAHILDQNWKGKKILHCFCQEKDELAIEVWQGMFLIIRCQSQWSYVLPAFQYPKSHTNSILLWQETQNLTIERVTVIDYDRSILIQLQDEYNILVKMHGNQSNVILYHQNKVKYLFRNNLAADQNLDYHVLYKPLPISPQYLYEEMKSRPFTCYISAIKQILPVFSKNMLLYLADKAQDKGNKEKVFETAKMMLNVLLNPQTYYVIEDEKQVFFSFFDAWKPGQKILFQDTDLIKVLHKFVRTYFQRKEFLEQKEAVSKYFEKKRNILRAKIKELEQVCNQENVFQQKADVIMANLHNIPEGQDNVNLYNFYTENYIKISLDTKLSPQQNAEKYYKKAKRFENLKQQAQIQIPVLKQELAEIDRHVETIQSIQEIKIWREHSYIWKEILKDKTQAHEFTLFRKFEVQGYVILASKDAENADLLTLKYAHKNDIWLHAKDVQGSHVVIKRAGSRHVPKTVIEAAACIAAYYSKAKGEQLAKVSVTEKKFVIKPKGYEAGKVKILKEEVVLVEPKLPYHQS